MTILTPVTLWKDFDDSLPLDEEILSERVEEGAVVREVEFSGRKTAQGRVRISATYVTPEGAKNFPAVLVLFEAGLPMDMALVKILLSWGYAALCVDYCGENASGRYTRYPADIDYANYIRAGRHLEYAEPTAKETSWYEWAGVARYAARYLSEREEVTKVGALGLRTGGEVLFKIAPYARISCFVSVCAAGWLAYRDIAKFAGAEQRIFDEERHRFIAGIDSQSYAPHVKCPVLLISAINDKKYNYDRVYDTFRQINPEVEKALLFSAHGNGLVGSHSITNVKLFFDKYLRDRAIFISEPISLGVEEDESGNLVVRGKFDMAGEIEEYGIFYTERVNDFRTRDWTRVLGRDEDLEDGVGIIPFSIYEGTKKALVYAFAQYTNGFSVTSKITEFDSQKKYTNSYLRSRVIYASREDKMNGFSVFRRRARSIADCFAVGNNSGVRLEAGYGGINGITAEAGLLSYRVSEPGFEPPEGASFRFDAYSKDGAKLKVVFYKDEEENISYASEVTVEKGGKWKSVLFDADDFKNELGAPMRSFEGVVSVAFFGEGGFVINNVVWL